MFLSFSQVSVKAFAIGDTVTFHFSALNISKFLSDDLQLKLTNAVDQQMNSYSLLGMI